MPENIQTAPKAFAVWFKNLSRWDAASFHGISWHCPKEDMSPIGSILKVRKEKVNLKETPFTELQPITIHFDGSIDPRKVSENREYSMQLYRAYPGDIVVAKIDLKNGAVGIVPDNLQSVVVTGHFAVYKPDLSKILPEYFHLLIQTSFFKSYLWRNKVGAEGRKEVKIDFFEAIEIPVPALSVQKAIVAHWHKAQDTISKAYDRVEQHKLGIETRFFNELGLEVPEIKERPKVFAVLWDEFRRWSLSYNQAAQYGADITQGMYEVVPLDSLLVTVQYGTSKKANRTGEGIPVIRMNNIVEGALDLSNLKHVTLTKKEQDSLLLKDGDILFNRTNSKELVGKCAVFHGEDEYVFASYLIRVTVDTDQANPDFVAYTINSRLGRQQIDALSRQIIGQANVNSEELRELVIPCPPRDIQDSIMSRVQEGQLEIARERIAAEQKAREVRAEIEALILGTREINI